MNNIEIIGQLKKFDTPTVCNALEVLDPSRRYYGFTRHLMHAFNQECGPIVGFAKTATMRSLAKSERTIDELKSDRLKYYKYVSEDDVPKIAVMQDLDGKEAGIGPFWGEFNTRIHQSLGCEAIITDGSLRDMALLPKDIMIMSAGPRPSHANVHVVDFEVQVNVFGMYVRSHDLVHADEHGAVSFPSELVPQIISAAKKIVEDEKPILSRCRKRKLSFDEIADLYMKR